VVLGGRVLVPCRAALPPEGHGGRDAAAVRHSRVWRQSIFLEIFGSSIYFSKIKKKIKKFRSDRRNVNAGCGIEDIYTLPQKCGPACLVYIMGQSACHVGSLTPYHCPISLPNRLFNAKRMRIFRV
jgi:hypothetical protein